MSQNTQKKDALLHDLKNAAADTDTLGLIVWWNVQRVQLTKTEFEKHLEAVGIDKKYARDHNYRSAFIRSLHELEAQRIIRKVEEDDFKLVFQFTAENLMRGANGDKSLEYEKETIVVIDKEEYRDSGDFSKALIRGKKEIKEKLVELFNQHKVSYKSSDVTRYVQRIFRDRADIISLRPQGAVYFIPYAYRNVVEQVSALLQRIGNGCNVEYAPIPNVESSRTMIKNALTLELTTDAKHLEEDLKAALNGADNVSNNWSVTRIGKIKNMLDRMEKYRDSGIINNEDTLGISTNLNELQQKILGARKLDLGDDEEKKSDIPADFLQPKEVAETKDVAEPVAAN